MFYTKTWIYFHVPKTSGTNILLNAEEYGDIKKGYKIIYMKDNSIDDAKKDLIKLKETSKEVGLYLDFIERSKRGLIR